MRPDKASGANIIQKIWNEHVVAEIDHETSLLLIDRIMLHERVGGRMLQGIKDRNCKVFDPRTTFGTMDHIVDTIPGRNDNTMFPGGREFIHLFRSLAGEAGITLFDMDSPDQGISHVISPQLGIALPGQTFVCGDSHTSTLGGLGAMAWGIGITQGEHALATQTLPIRRPKSMRIWCDGALAEGVTAKDLILWIIGHYGADGGQGHAIEFAGPAIRSLGIEARLTLCNMAVEFDAWIGIIAPDDATFSYLEGRRFAPRGRMLDAAVAHWRRLCSDEDAQFDIEQQIDCSAISPQVTWGTSPEHVTSTDGRAPNPDQIPEESKRRAAERALSYAGLKPGELLSEVAVDVAFIGSCTNARIDDLRAAAKILKGRHVAPGIKALCVPGSTAVKRQAEAEGLDKIFRDSGFEWREAGCSLCFFSNGESFGDGKRIITSTNRNFENRQGPGVKSHLASPATVAATAVTGKITGANRLAS